MSDPLTFKLKQHTPIIHFLHDQDGATLRATELKPKLDKFLIKHAFNDNFDDYKTHLIGWEEGKNKSDFDEKMAFDYKLKIISGRTTVFDIEILAPNKHGVVKEKQFPLFFGNMGKDESKASNDKKRFVFTNEPIMVEVFTFNQPLLSTIGNCFARFLFETNFGTRQSKGFGSFYLDEKDPKYKIFKLDFMFSTEIQKPINHSDHSSFRKHFYDIFYEVELLNKALRSGINLKPKIYFKSLMFKYAMDHGIQWDKKTIKETYFENETKKQQQKHKDPDILKRLMRDALGLSTSETWMSYSDTVITKENPDIDRFKSPITYKIIRQEKTNKYDVFLLTESIDPGFAGKEFTVKANGKGELKIRTPNKFNVDHFLNYAFTKFELQTHVDPIFLDSKEFRIIKKIFNSVKTNIEAYHG